jgi:hypothetical protein
VERAVSGREIEVAVLGNDEPSASLPGEVLPGKEWYDYEAKYFADDTRYLCPCGLPDGQEERVQQVALAAFRLLGCTGWGRVDLMLDRAGNPKYAVDFRSVYQEILESHLAVDPREVLDQTFDKVSFTRGALARCATRPASAKLWNGLKPRLRL